MARGFFTVGFENQTTTALDLLEFPGSSGITIALSDLTIKCRDVIIDAAETWMRLKIVRGNSVVGSGGSIVTPVPVSHIGSSPMTCRILSTEASGGTPVDVIPGDGFNVRDGYKLHLPEEDWIWMSGASVLSVRRMTNDSRTLSLKATFLII